MAEKRNNRERLKGRKVWHCKRDLLTSLCGAVSTHWRNFVPLRLLADPTRLCKSCERIWAKSLIGDRAPTPCEREVGESLEPLAREALAGYAETEDAEL